VAASTHCIWCFLEIMKAVLLVPLVACTTLGPMPATTGVSALPAGKPGVEVQAAAVPGFLLSDAAHKPKGQPLNQLAGLVDLDRWLLKGVIVGMHSYGDAPDRNFEPYLGYRHREGRASFMGLAYGTKATAEEYGASYEAKRIGGEIAADAILDQPRTWLTLHAQLGVSATYMKATGRYCIDADGVAIDCDENGPNTFADGKLHGTYGAAMVTIAADLGRLPSQFFHEARLSITYAVGSMPRVRNGTQQSADVYQTYGLALTVGFGARD
jgi:hypothetical protein